MVDRNRTSRNSNNGEPESSDKAKTEDAPQRLSTTCTQCRFRKIKCDSAKPTCAACLRSHRECVYQFRRKPGLLTGANRELKDKLSRLQNEYHALEQKFNALQGHRNSLAGSDTVLSGACSSFGSENPEKGSQRPAAEMDELPPPALVNKAIDVYFAVISPALPLFSRSKVCSAFFPPQDGPTYSPPWPTLVLAMISLSLRFLPDILTSNPPVNDATRATWSSVARREAILRIVDFEDIPCSQLSFENLLSTALLALQSAGNRSDPASLGTLALTAIHVLHSGIASDPYASSPSSFAFVTKPALTLPTAKDSDEENARSLLLWGTFVLDCHSALSCGREFILPRDKLRRPAPSHPLLFHYINIVDHLAEVHSIHTTYRELSMESDIREWLQSIWKKHKDLRRWYEKLPINLKLWLKDEHSDKTAPSDPLKASELQREIPLIALIHATYYVTVVRLLSHVAFPPLSSTLTPSSFSRLLEPDAPNAAKECFDRSRALALLCKKLMNRGYLQLTGPLFPWLIWVAARATFEQYATLIRQGIKQSRRIIFRSPLQNSARDVGAQPPQEVDCSHDGPYDEYIIRCSKRARLEGDPEVSDKHSYSDEVSQYPEKHNVNMNRLIRAEYDRTTISDKITSNTEQLGPKDETSKSMESSEADSEAVSFAVSALADMRRSAAGVASACPTRNTHVAPARRIESQKRESSTAYSPSLLEENVNSATAEIPTGGAGLSAVRPGQSEDLSSPWTLFEKGTVGYQIHTSTLRGCPLSAAQEFPVSQPQILHDPIGIQCLDPSSQLPTSSACPISRVRSPRTDLFSDPSTVLFDIASWPWDGSDSPSFGAIN